jgi:hypothetical protein
MESKQIIMTKKKIVKRICLFLLNGKLCFFLVEKQSDDGEQFDDSVMDMSSSLPIEKSSTARYVIPAKSG